MKPPVVNNLYATRRRAELALEEYLKLYQVGSRGPLSGFIMASYDGDRWILVITAARKWELIGLVGEYGGFEVRLRAKDL